MRVVRRRGELMYESGVEAPGRDGRDPRRHRRVRSRRSAREATREAGLVVPANYNCPGQIVICGEEAGVERAMVLCKEAGAKRAIRLNVSGAFHSPLMESARDGLAEALDAASFGDPHFPVYANVNGEAGARRPTRAKQLLLEQLVAARCAGRDEVAGDRRRAFRTRCTSRWARATCSRAW